MLVIPDLSHTPFSALSVRLLLDNLGAHSDPHVLVRAFRGKTVKVKGSDATTFSKPYLLSVEYAERGRDVWIDVEVRLDVLALLADDEPGWGSASPITVHEFQAYLADHLGVLDGLKLIVEATCEFEVNVNELPPGGIVRRGIVAQAQFGNDTLFLCGAQFEINDDPDHKISWFQEVRDSIGGSIFSSDEKVFGSSLLTDRLNVAQNWLHRYILESGIAETK
jgi:hypothetical protein